MHFFRVFALLLAVVIAGPATARDIIDMAGRTVTIPDKMGKVYSSSHPVSLLLYALAPDLLTGINFPVREELKPYLPKEVVDLPVIGAVMGHGGQMDPEEVLRLHPDFVLVWLDRFSDNDRILAQFTKVGLPVIFVRLDTLADHPAALRFLGDVLQRPERAKELETYVSAVLARLADTVGRLPIEKRRKVYYAEGTDGLATECDRSWHAEAIPLAGGDNVHHCEQSNHGGFEKVGLEQVMLYQPDFILAQDRKFTEAVLQDGAWRDLPAVKSRAVAFVPRLPFNWIDRPPSFMRALGAQWLANALYPDLYPLDLRAETRRFYALFLKVDLTEAQIDAILGSGPAR